MHTALELGTRKVALELGLRKNKIYAWLGVGDCLLSYGWHYMLQHAWSALNNWGIVDA